RHGSTFGRAGIRSGIHALPPSAEAVFGKSSFSASSSRLPGLANRDTREPGQRPEHKEMRFSLTPFWRLASSFAIAAIFGFAGVARAIAEPVPLPTVDFEIKATMMGTGAMTMHHSGDRARVETDVGPMPVTGIMDLKARNMYMLMAIPGIGNTAMEVGIGDASYGQVYGNGKRVGSDTVAGEPCELWEMSTAKEKNKKAHFSGPVIVCLSKDHIPLRTEATVNGKR